jgi:4-hydroxy-4-methyl-2-oxoglutarate aldolase
MTQELSQKPLAALRMLDTCLVSSAIDRLNLRLANEGYANSRIRCQFKNLGPMVGYAVTAKIHTAATLVAGRRIIEGRELWESILTTPEPRVLVLQDIDRQPGMGAFLDLERVTIALRLGCVGAATNGAVRELPRINPLGFHLFSQSISVSRAYSHVAEVGTPVELGGLTVRPGELLHGDIQGLLSVPGEAVSQIPKAALQVLEDQRRITDLRGSSDFSLPKFWEVLRILDGSPDRK